MGFGAIARKLSPTMLLLARLPASEAKRLSQAAQQGLDAVLFDAGSFSDLKDEPKNAGELPVGAMLSSVRGDDAKAFAEAGIDFLAFDSGSTPADLLLDEKLGFVLALNGEPSDSELRVLEGLPLDALLAPPLSTTLTVSTQLGLRRLAFFSQRPLLLEVPPDIPSSQLQSLREAGVIGVLHLGYGVPLPEATAIALLDRVISVFSIIVFGSIAYAISPKPRGLGRIPGPVDIPTGRTTAA